MKLTGLNISTQLKLGLGFIILLAGILGAVSWYQANLLWQETEGMYKHPLQVRRALGEIRVDVLNIALEMKELFLADSNAEQEAIILTIDKVDADAERHFNVLRTQYLGPINDIDSAYDLFVQWRTIRAETFRLLREGKSELAEERAKVTGVQGRFIQKMMAAFEKVSDFQIVRGDKFYADAKKHQQALFIRMLFLLGSILLTAFMISYLLVRRIREPLADLLTTTQQFGMGDLDARCSYQSGNEFGKIASALNNLTTTIADETRRKELVMKLSGVMLQEESLQDFCDALMRALIETTTSQVAAVYLLNSDKSDFDHFTSIGLSAQAWGSFSASGYEGEFGAALATKTIQHIKKIPKDSHVTFSTVTGDFIPREIITIPILSGKEVVAVISLAGIRSYSREATDLISDIYPTLTARFNGVLTFARLEELFARLQEQNHELEAQRTELSQQKDELNEQNIELEMQKHQLDQAVKIKNNFLARMSHELRTPLNSILALAGVLSRRLKAKVPDEEFGYFGIINRNGSQLLELINDILELSRMDAGVEEISPKRFPLPDLIGEVSSNLSPQALEKGITLRVESIGDLPEITSDYAKCMHVLQNIVANAIKFTEKGEVVISAEADPYSVRISVADTGIGIPADQIPYIFDEFRQADEGLSRKFGGTGLGLAIAQRFAELLQGKIVVESEEGKGSVFTWILPVRMQGLTEIPGDHRDSNAEEPIENESYISANTNVGGKRVLVVEDSDAAIIQMTDILEQEGFRVDVARNGREAIIQVGQFIPDAMILDLMMPEVDGFEVVRMVRSMPEASRLPVLILTAKHVTKEELSFLKGNHIFQLIQKGDISREELLKLVSTMVHGKK